MEHPKLFYILLQRYFPCIISQYVICKLLIQILHVQNHFTKMLKKLVDSVFSAGLLLEGVFKEATPPAQ